jgi:CHASE3 domain sensor protein
MMHIIPNLFSSGKTTTFYFLVTLFRQITLVSYVETRGVRSMSEETRRIEETIEAWAQALAAEAGEVAAGSYLRAARKGGNRPRSE